METLAPITTSLDLVTKAYVDSKVAAASGGFFAYSGRWGPAWMTPKASLTVNIPSYWIYAYRLVAQVNTKAVAVEVATAQAGGTFNLCAYSDANPWPGTLWNTTALTTDVVGAKSWSYSLPTGALWLAIHNTGTSTISIRGVIGPNPYSPGAIAVASSLDCGFGYSVGSATTPPSWPAGSGSDVDGILFSLQAT